MEHLPTVFQFISKPSDVNFRGNVHGGNVMQWIDQAGYACASQWCGGYCVTVYVGGIRFYQPIKIGQFIKIEAKLIYTGTSSMHISIDVFARDITSKDFKKKTHCIIVFVAVDAEGHKIDVPKWTPETEEEKHLEIYAKKLMDLRTTIEDEMKPFITKPS